jgi:putative addiction module antidote
MEVPQLGHLKVDCGRDSTGLVTPKEMLKRLKVERGDTLFAIETLTGYLPDRYDPEVEQQLQIGRRFMKKYRETFKALAK